MPANAKKMFAPAAAFFAAAFCLPSRALALGEAWTPMIQAADFTGIKTDMLTTSSGVILLVLIILGLGLLIKVFMR